MTTLPGDPRNIAALLEIMRALRDPQAGCPWDIAQTSLSIAPYAIEEAHEVVDAIVRDDPHDIKDELGDLLLQVVFHAQIAQEQDRFDFGDVVQAITSKMIRRHPHVFGERRTWTPDEVRASWNEIKAREKSERLARCGEASGEGDAVSVLDGVSAALPAGLRAVKLQDKAAKVGFDWPDVGQVLAKADEELAELKEAVASGDTAHAAEELGDLLFVLANVARWQGVDPEVAMACANAKFERRFKRVEALLRVRGKTPAESDLAEMDALWNEAKNDR